MEVVEIISNLGFPIACVIALFYLWNQERVSHSEEIEKMVEAINNNSILLEKLLERMEK